MAGEAAQYGWDYLDLWDKISGSEFTNTAIHMSPPGTQELAGLLAPAIEKLSNASK